MMDGQLKRCVGSSQKKWGRGGCGGFQKSEFAKLKLDGGDGS